MPSNLATSEEYARRIRRAVRRTENLRGDGVRVTDDAIEIRQTTQRAPVEPAQAKKFLWVKITAAESGGGKYQGKSYTHDGTSDVSASGDLAESELGTLASTVDCRVLNFAEEGQSTHDLTSGTPKVDTFLCHWFRTNSDGIKVCAVVAIDWETCA